MLGKEQCWQLFEISGDPRMYLEYKRSRGAGGQSQARAKGAEMGRTVENN